MAQKNTKKTSRKIAEENTAHSKPKFPYTPLPGVLRKFLADAPKKPKPIKVDGKLLKAWGNLNTKEIEIVVEKLFKASIIYVSTMSHGLGTIAYLLKEIEKYSKLYDEGLNENHIGKLTEEESSSARDSADEYYKVREQYRTDLQNTQSGIVNYVSGAEFDQVRVAMTEYEVLIRKYIKDQRLKILNQST